MGRDPKEKGVGLESLGGKKKTQGRLIIKFIKLLVLYLYQLDFILLITDN